MKGSFLIYFALLCIVLGATFYSSSTPYEKQDIRGNIGHVIDAKKASHYLGGISFVYGKKEISIRALGVPGFIEFFIRKATHFLTFALTAFLMYHVLRGWTMPQTALPWSGFLALAAAVLDEWHQSFTPNRTPMLSDVVLDGTGICLMLVMIGLVLAFRTNRKRRPVG
ncbi:UNVERIFIED_CONTAM: hypothetical protein ABID98_005425 [Brevibacillus sp. OAP136]